MVAHWDLVIGYYLELEIWLLEFHLQHESVI